MDQSPTPTIDAMKAAGQFNEAWAGMEKFDAEWLEAFLKMGSMPRFRGHLDAKTWELISLAVDASVTHLYLPGMDRHIKGALDAGATPLEVAAVLEAVAVLGIHSCAQGFPLLFREMEARGLGA